MQNKILLYVVILLSVVLGCIRSFKKETSFFIQDSEIEISPFEEKKPILIAVKDVTSEEVESIDIEEYLIGVVAGEMPASFNFEALKAQAIASRTFAYYKILTSDKDYDLTNDTTSQVFINEKQMHEKWKEDYSYYLERIQKSIKETKNMVLTYDNQVISSYYFSMSNGYTENSELVFNESKPYLKSVSSKEDISNNNYMVSQSISRDMFCQNLEIFCEKITINDVKRTESNRVDTIIINDKLFTGTDIRRKLNLRSTDFDIDIKEDITITTRGYGHGVGMSQYGANEMANEGYNYKDILYHYYQNTKIDDINNLL